jgi:hypothetical protein
MERKENMPMWVFFGLSSINTRKGGMILFWSCMLFAVACIPWAVLVPGIDFIPEAIRLDDWSYAGMTLLKNATW